MHSGLMTLEKVFSHTHREELASLAMDVVQVPRPTGSDKARFCSPRVTMKRYERSEP